MCPVFPLQDEKKAIFFFKAWEAVMGPPVVLRWAHPGQEPGLPGLVWHKAPDALGNIWDDKVYTT